MKENNNTELLKIIQKYVDGKASQEEIKFIHLYYDQFEDLENRLDVKSIEEKTALQNEMKNHILAHALTKEEKENLPVIPLKTTFSWYKISAVASLLIVASFAIYFAFSPVFKTETESNLAGNQVINDIEPGSDKATLLLADGTIIDLDNVASGNLLEQGNSTIIKLEDGQLVYQLLNEGLSSSKMEYNTIATPRGGKYQLALADGSKVWLNSASSIRFPTTFSGKNRKVEITGEAYFEISHNKTKPFIVQVNDTEVEVLGTHFNINSYEDESTLKTTLLEGSIKVNHGNKSILLTPGEEASVRKASHEITVKSGINVKEAIAWKSGYFQFNNADVETIMRQLARWYDLKIVYESEIPLIKFKGKIQRDLNLSEILEFLKNDIHFERSGNTITIKP